MNNFIEILQMPFFLMALFGGIIVAFLGSFYGVFVVQRRMSFLGDGLAHAAFGGVALGLLLNAEPLWIALPVTVLVSVLIKILKEKTNLEIDTSIGIFFAVSMALGIIFISLKRDYSVDAFSYLFGSILLVQKSDLLSALALALITIGLSFKYWKRWAYSTFDPELAAADRHKISYDDYLLSILIAVTIVLSIKLVGIVLIAAFLVIPAASARLISKRFFSMTVNSIIIGVAATVVGLFLSLLLDLPSGAIIIMTQATVFFILVLVTKKIIN
jgi:zinc transport system permease protein